MAGKLKWRAFAIWIGLPYLFFLVVVPVMMWLFGKEVNLVSDLDFRRQASILAFCGAPAGLGTMILWMLPIRRPWQGVITGSILAMGGILAWAWFEATFFGGFEKNAGTYILAIMLMIPNCLAGAYAGFLRSKVVPA